MKWCALDGQTFFYAECIFHALSSLNRPNRPAAAGTNHFVVLIEEDIVVNGEKTVSFDELIKRTSMQRDDITWSGWNVVAPGLAGIDCARASHPIIIGRAGKHKQHVDVGRSDDSAPSSLFGVLLIHIKWIHIACRFAELVNGLFGQRVRDGFARFSRDNVIPNLSGRVASPEVSVVFVIQGVLRQ